MKMGQYQMLRIWVQIGVEAQALDRLQELGPEIALAPGHGRVFEALVQGGARLHWVPPPLQIWTLERPACIPTETPHPHPHPGQGHRESTLSLLWAPKSVRTGTQKTLSTPQELHQDWGKGPAMPMVQALFLSSPPRN